MAPSYNIMNIYQILWRYFINVLGLTSEIYEGKLVKFKLKLMLLVITVKANVAIDDKHLDCEITLDIRIAFVT